MYYAENVEFKFSRLRRHLKYSTCISYVSTEISQCLNSLNYYIIIFNSQCISPAAKSHKKPRNRCTFNSLGRKFLWSAKVRVGTGVLRTTGSPGGCGPFFQKSSSIDWGLKQGFYMFCPSSKSTFCVYE